MALSNNLLARYGANSLRLRDPADSHGHCDEGQPDPDFHPVGISTGAQPIIGFNYGSKNLTRVRKAFDIALVASEIVAVIAFLIFQFAPMRVVSLFGSEEGLYNEFAVMSFRIFLLLCPLTGFQTVAAIYLQAIANLQSRHCSRCPGRSSSLCRRR